MAVFSSIQSTLIQVGKAVVQGLMQTIKDNFDALYTSIGTLESAAIPNGSFEIDSDKDDVPDTWTRSLFTGGGGGISPSEVIGTDGLNYTCISDHTAADANKPTTGASWATYWNQKGSDGVVWISGKKYKSELGGQGKRCVWLEHPGGAGNGGGYVLSDYMPCGPLEFLPVAWRLKTTNASTHNKVVLKFYDQDKVAISGSDQIIYDAQSGGPTAWRELFAFGLAPATAHYYRIELQGGVNDVDQAGTVYFDNVRTGMPGPLENYRWREVRELFEGGPGYLTAKWTLLGVAATGVFTNGDESGVYADSNNGVGAGNTYCQLPMACNLGKNSLLTLRTKIFYNSNNYVKVGYWSSATGMNVDPTNGIYFRSVASGNWYTVTRNGGAETATDTGVAFGNDTLKDFRILRLTDRALFFINDVLVATHTTNLPTAVVDCINAGGYDAQASEYCIARVLFCHYLAGLA